MTEKRFENRLNKDNIKFNTQNPVWDNEKQDALNVFEMIDMLNHLHEENQALKNELNGMEQLLQSYRKTIKHDAELLADATKNGYLPPLEDWRELK